MSVPDPTTVSVGDDITAALWNLEVRDALTFLLDPPQARLRHSTTQSVATGSPTAVVFNSEDYDNYNGHSTSSNTSRYTVVEAGTYQCHGVVTWVSNGTGKREAFFRVNGSTSHHADARNGTTTGRIALAVSGLISLAVGDYVELVAFQDSGGALNIDNTFAGGQRLDVIWRST